MPTVKVNLTISGEDCDEATAAQMEFLSKTIRDAFVHAVQATGADLRISRTVSEDGSTSEKIDEITDLERMAARVQELYRENRTLKQLLVDADEVALKRGDKYGLCDSIDNDKKPYPSASCAAMIEHFRVVDKVQPMLFLKDLESEPS